MLEKVDGHAVQSDSKRDHQRAEVSRIERLALVDEVDQGIVVNDDFLLANELRLLYVVVHLVPAEEIFLATGHW